MADVYYKSAFGGLRLWLSNISTDRPRSQVVHELSAGDDYVVQDRGRGPVRVRCQALFEWMDGDELSPLDRMRKLLELVDDRPRLFTHPVHGTFLARVGPFSDELDGDGVLTAQLEFIEVSDVKPVSPAGAGTIPAAGAGAVDSAAAALKNEIDDVGITDSKLPGIADDASAAVDEWATSDGVNSRDVIAKTGSLTSQLGDEADDLDSDLALWSVLKATVLLAETVRLAAQATTAGSSSTFVVRIGSTIALRALLASVYPADEAAARYDEVMALNDIATPGFLDPGSELELPLASPRPRSG